MISDLHFFDAGKQPCDAVGIQLLQAELNARQHDIGRAGRNQVDIHAVILPGFDPASRELADDLIAVDDEATTINVGHFGEAELSSLAGEHFCALIGIAGPRAVQIKGIRTASHYQE
ncbi:MAG TPA: hypothetical protein VK620_13140 [Bradyrhizobium sp.]|nr:hypothetical protein [Bradyrhizobium sp.]